MAGQLRALRELSNPAVAPGSVTPYHHRLRLFLAHAVHVLDADPHRAVLDDALRRTDVHIRRTSLDAAPLAVAHERRRRVEAHWLRVQQGAEELRRVVVAQPC